GFAGGSFGGGGGFAGGSFGGGGGFAGGSFGGGGGFAGGSFGGGGGFAGGSCGGGGAYAGGFAGGSFGGGGAFGGGFAGGSFGGGGAFAGGFAGGSAGESCFAPIALSVPSVFTGSTRLAAANHEFAAQAPCRRTGAGAADVAFSFVVPAQRTVSVVLTPSGWDAVINLVADPMLCGAPGNPGRTCLAGADDPERVSYRNPTTSPVTVYLVVGGFAAMARGDFTLRLTLLDGDRCESPVTIVNSNSTLANEPIGNFTDDYRGAGTSCAAQANGPDRVYLVAVPPQTALTVQSAPVGMDTSISLALSAAQCTARQCVAPPGDTVGIGAIDRATYANTSNLFVDVLVIIDSSTPASAGTFTLTTSLGPIQTTGDTCAAPTLLAPGVFLSNESLSGFQDNASFGPGCDLRVGPDRVYAIDVGGLTELTVRVTPTVMGFNPTISIASSLSACQQPTCVSFGVNGEARVSNFSFVPNRYYLIVDGIVGPGGSSYSLGTAIAPVSSFDAGLPIDAGTFVDAGTFIDAGMPLGETCFAPEALTLGTPVAVALSSAQNDTSGASMSCAYGPGPDRTFSVTIPPMQRLTIIASPQSAFDLSLSFAADAMSCASGVCLASMNSSTGSGSETLVFDNTSSVPRSGIVVIDSMTLASGSVGYFASLSNLSTAAGDTCLNAIPIVGSQTLTGQTTNGFTKNYSLMGPPCVGPLGPEVVYSVTLGPGDTLTVVMNSAQDAAINIVAGPASACATATTCLAGADTGASGTETASYTNGSAATQTVFVMLARWGSATGTLTYDVSFSLTP
ncbi:MAG: hypothetical protein Q8N26_11440, partial [Myxococcales bacterium]|nr:hypothetical protein [Myxococcales bacterium]